MDGVGTVWVLAMFGGYAFGGSPAADIQEWGVDRLLPLHDNRQIATTSLHWRRREKAFFGDRLTLRLGATVTRATGRIEQLGDQGAYTLASPGWGAGPALDSRFTLLARDGWRLTLDSTVAVLLYDRRFPTGGKHHNGMLQAGPSVGATLAGGSRIDVGWRWMHVSNGQGLGPHNPSYEGTGLTVRWRLPL